MLDRWLPLLVAFVAGAWLCLPAAAQGDPAQGDPAAAPGGAFRLAEVQWQRRVLLLFAPSPEDAAYREQLRRFRAAPGAAFAERDLLLVWLPAEGEAHRRAWGAEASPPQLVNAASAQRLRERFGAERSAPSGDEAAPFLLVLVGKDGTEKRRDDAPVDAAAIFDEIDAMPMRRREMKRQQRRP